MNLLNNFISVFIASAPWLMLGLLVAGLMKALVPTELLSRHLGKSNYSAAIKAALLGAPLPLCSCGVIPAAMGLRRSGASKAATTSFLISTPETGVDSISITYAMLGPFMAIIRPIAAIVSAIAAGVWVSIYEQHEQTKSSCCSSKSEPETTSCCSSKSKPEPETTSCCSSSSSKEETSCCSSKAIAPTNSIIKQLIAGVRFTFVDLIRDISLWLLIGLGLAAVIKTFVPIETLTAWGDGLLAFIVMAAIGVPMYICATASTPIAAGLLFSGVSPGAILVFMLVGPATNIATIGLVKKELGNHALTAYLSSVVITGFAFGYLTNFLAGKWDINFIQQAKQVQAMVNPQIASACGIILGCLIAYHLGNKLRKQAAKYTNKAK